MILDPQRAQELAFRYPGRVVAHPLLLDVTSEFEPDPAWSFTDAAGHTHRWVGDGENPIWWTGKVPSVERVITGTYWCDDCDDEHETAELRCVECGEVVKPGSVRATTRREILQGYDVDPIEFWDYEGEMSDDGRTFATPVGDTFRVYSFAETYPFQRARVCVLAS